MLLGYARGKVGDLVFSRRLGQQVTRAYNPSPLNPQSDAQMAQRTRLAALVAAYRCMRIILDHSFTSRKEGATSYNAFVSANMAIAPYLSKEQARQGVVVVLPYVVSRGVLSRIFVSGSGDNAYTNIGLGSLEIDDDTTIAEFTQAVLQNNAGWQEGDQLTYFSVIQTALPGQTDFPHASAQEFKVTLDTQNQETLRTYLPDYGSATVNGFLGHGTHYSAGGFCWIHSRKDASGTLQVSSQELVCNIDNSQWQGAEQEDFAKKSYGVDPEKYLVPGDNDSSPVNVTTEILQLTAAPGNSDDEPTFDMTTAPARSYLPVGMEPGTPFTITLAFSGNNLSSMNTENTKVLVSVSSADRDPKIYGSPITPTSMDILGAGLQGNLQFAYTLPEAGNRISGLKVQVSGKDLFVWEYTSKA